MWKDIFNLKNVLTSDAMKIEPKAVVKHYCVWFDFYCIRRYLEEAHRICCYLQATSFQGSNNNQRSQHRAVKWDLPIYCPENSLKQPDGKLSNLFFPIYRKVTSVNACY